jgi:hypothetical protein
MFVATVLLLALALFRWSRLIFQLSSGLFRNDTAGTAAHETPTGPVVCGRLKGVLRGRGGRRLCAEFTLQFERMGMLVIFIGSTPATKVASGYFYFYFY